ncbi:MAG: ergothioneine biosynthesis protein EgtB [Acidobacteriaceae bacterium]
MPATQEHLASPTSGTASAAALLARFRHVREATISLCSDLSPEDMMVQSCPEASPVKWHLAHTSWFFETFVLRDFLPGYKPFHPDFQWLFNSYYNSLGDMPEKKLRASFSRPPLAEILAYRSHVDTSIATLLQTSGGNGNTSLPEEAVRRIVLGFEHEQQHLELIATDIKHALYTNPLHPPLLEDAWQPAAGIAPPVTWVAFAPGLVEIGVTPDPSALDAFAFDNETPRHRVYLAPFALASRLVTCAEYLAFIDDNAYNRPELWLSEGWTTIREHAWEAPLYWHRDNTTQSGWRLYTNHGFRPLDDLSETPVCHLSFFEADAFARWSGHRLPTEFEWEHAAATLSAPGSNPSPGHAEHSHASPSVATSPVPPASSNLLESGNLHPTRASSPPGLQQLFGDVWEWTSSPYTGYPGYRPLPGALGEYNGKFMSSQIILRGGSCVTPVTHIRATYRNFFSPATRWQFSGLRLAHDNRDTPVSYADQPTQSGPGAPSEPTQTSRQDPQ